MNLVFLLAPLHIALIIGGSVLGVLLLVVLLHFTLFAAMRYKKQVRELSRRFEYLHALLSGQDSQYLRRIESISQINLLYADTHATFNKRFKDIRDKSDSTAQATINNLRDLLAEHNYKALKDELPRAKEIIENFDDEVNGLNNDLLLIVKPEEKCRALSLQLKEELRKIKQDYFVKQADLALVANSFDELFNQIEDKFKEFENYVESATYEEAKNLLPDIEAVIKELGRDLKELPNICVTITGIIPGKLASLSNRYEEMCHEDYPLHHLAVRGNIEDMNANLKAITKRIQSFDLRHAMEDLDAILARIDEYFDLFELEKEARTVFENECDSIYAAASAVEKKYIRLSNSLPDVRKIYVIPADAQARIDGIGVLINKAGASKRSLDTLIHSVTKQPYSLLVEKMHALRDEAEQSSAAIDSFQEYLRSLKSDAETAMEAISAFHDKLHLCEVAIHKIDLPVIDEKYGERIEECYDLIDHIHECVCQLPIDIKTVNDLVAELNEKGIALSEETMADYEECLLADAAIVYANRDRRHLGEVNDALKQTESYFFNGDFKRAYDETGACLKRLRGE